MAANTAASCGLHFGKHWSRISQVSPSPYTDNTQEEQCTILLQVLGFKRRFNALELTRNLFILIGPLKINTIPLFLTSLHSSKVIMTVTRSQWPPTGQYTELTKKDQLSSIKFSFPFQYGLMFLCGECFGHCSLEQLCIPAHAHFLVQDEVTVQADCQESSG